MATPDFTQMSDDDLAKLAGGKSAPAAPPSGPDFSTMSDEDLAKLAGGTAPSDNGANRPWADVAMRGMASAIPFANDIAAAGDTATSYLPNSIKQYIPGINQQDQSGESLSQRFSENKARQEATDKADAANYPITSAVAPFAGALAAVPIAGPIEGISSGISRVAPRLAGAAADTLAGGAVGAGYGALSGLGTGNSLDERLGNAQSGAESGGIGGAIAPTIAKGVGKVFNAAAIPFRSAETNASNAIAQAAAKDAALGTTTLSPADLAAGKDMSNPVLTGDMAGQNVRDLARTATNISPEANSLLGKAVNERYADQGPEVKSFLQDVAGTDLNAKNARDMLKAASKAEVGPLYDAAMAAGDKGVWNPGVKQVDKDGNYLPNLQDLLTLPEVQDAVKGAGKLARLDAVTTGRPVVKNPFIDDGNGNLVLRGTDADGNVATPTLRFWDIVKRGLDTQRAQALSGNDRGLATAIGTVKKQLVQNLTSPQGGVPEYADALAAASKNFGYFGGADNALEAGENFLKMAPAAKTADMKAALAGFSPIQKQIFAQGLLSQAAQSAVNAPVRRNVIGMFNSPEMAERLRLGLQGLPQAAGSPSAADQVETFLRVKNAQNMLKDAVGGNSTTIRQKSGLEQAGHGLAGMVSGALGSPMAGAITGGLGAFHEEGFDPKAIGMGVAGGAFAGLVGSKLKGAHAAMWRSVGEQLASPDPSKVNAAIARVSKNPYMLTAVRATENALTSISSRAAPLMPSQQQPLVPAYQ